MKRPLFTVGCALLVMMESAATQVATCDIGGPKAVRIERDSKVVDTYVYYVRIGAKRTPVFGDLERSRGASVKTLCTGGGTRALVLSGEFTGNYIKGFAVTYSHNIIERTDFAEHSRPSWLYRNEGEMLVVVQTDGLGEKNKKFTVYHHRFGSTGEPQYDGQDTVPADVGYERSRLIWATP